MRISTVGCLVGLLTLGAGVTVQATPITLSPIANGSTLLEVGETVTFTGTMAKADWGVHDYDALKAWIAGTPFGPSTPAAPARTFKRGFDPHGGNMRRDTTPVPEPGTLALLGLGLLGLLYFRRKKTSD